MPKVFSKDQKIKIVQYGGDTVQSFSFKETANDFLQKIKCMISKK